MARVAFILAGGRSSRFGRDKAAVEVAGESVLARLCRLAAGVCDEVLTLGDGYDVPDLEPFGGPVQAIVAGVRARPGADFLLLACDLPVLVETALARLVAPLPSGVDARVPRLDGQAQSLCAFYSASCAAAFEAVWGEQRRALQAVLARLNIEWVDAADLGVPADSLADFDTPADLDRLTGR